MGFRLACVRTSVLCLLLSLVGCKPVRDGQLTLPPGTSSPGEGSPSPTHFDPSATPGDSPPETFDPSSTPEPGGSPSPTEVPTSTLPPDPNDQDGDGYQADPEDPQALVDCDDSDADINPGAAEICNGEDEDCDGQEDDGVAFLWYRDADGDGYGNEEGTPLKNCSSQAPNGYVADSSDCDDTDADIHPGVEEVCDGIDNDCDSTTTENANVDQDADGYGKCLDCDDTDPNRSPGHTYDVVDGGVDNDCNELTNEGYNVSSVAPVILQGTDPNSWFGGVLSGPGDLDQDGHRDFVIASALYSYGANLVAGGVTFFYGTGDRSPATNSDFAQGFYSGQDIDSLGTSLATGDINGDGKPDVVVGASGASRLYLHYGGTRVTGTHEQKDLGPYLKSTLANSTGLGFSVGIADLNGDGFADVVGASSVTEWLYFYFGEAVKLSSEVDAKTFPQLNLNYVQGSMGSVMTGVGDLDGDGYEEIAVSGPAADPRVNGVDRTDAGSVVIVWGGHKVDFVNGLVETTFIAGPSKGDKLGTSMGAVGDITGDGLPDFLVGALGASDGESAAVHGAIYVVPGKSERYPEFVDGLSLNTSFVTEQEGTELGSLSTLSAVGDLNSDGLDDFGMGLPLYRFAGDEVGTIAIFFGRAGGFHGEISIEDADAFFPGGRVGDEISNPKGVGDLDGDGVDDLLLGAYRGSQFNTTEPTGTAYLFYGYPVVP